MSTTNQLIEEGDMPHGINSFSTREVEFESIQDIWKDESRSD